MREWIKDSAIRIISVQREALKSHAKKLAEKFNYTLKEATYAKLSQKEEKITSDWFARTHGQNNPKLAMVKRSSRLNTQWPREENNKVQEWNHARLSDDNPSTPVSTIVPSYSPTISLIDLSSTFPSQKPNSVP